jgi:hypothetical protein
MGMSSAPNTAGARAGPSWHPAANDLGRGRLISRGRLYIFLHQQLLENTT